jgi:hypothetical protein
MVVEDMSRNSFFFTRVEYYIYVLYPSVTYLLAILCKKAYVYQSKVFPRYFSAELEIQT